MYGFTHTLTLIRSLNNKDALVGVDAAVEGKVVFSKISWILPIVEPSQVAGYELVKLINEQRTFSIAFRARNCVNSSNNFQWRLGIKTEKPRYIVLGFQTGRENDQKVNMGLFDHCKLKKCLRDAEQSSLSCNRLSSRLYTEPIQLYIPRISSISGKILWNQ